MKLVIELVPGPLWGINPRKLMGKSKWDRIRKQVYSDYNHTCGICSRDGRLEAHEIWEYDDTNFVQRLVGFIALCPACHGIKHLGYSAIAAFEGKGRWVDTDDYATCHISEGGMLLYQEDEDGPVVQLRRRNGKTQIMNDPIEELILHFMDVNGCSREEFEEHRAQAFEKHHQRSQHKNWRVDWGPYQDLVDKSRAENT